MKAGTIVLADFAGATGVKRRPALVISTALYHVERPDVILTIITSQITKSNAKTDYILQDWQAVGLTLPSVVRVYMGMKMPAELTKIGELSDRDWEEVQKRLQISIEV